ncbi:MAG: Gfo/Idh/MocA family oxidoreductase [Rhizobiaceae bacterium]|nr:Gfo/Idh/MocA family oxidoreductase [Rhizobiaceae bacterium]
MEPPPSPQTNESRPFGWGIVGTGVIARQFAEDLKLAGKASVVAVSSRDVIGAKRFADELGGIRAYQELDALLNDRSVDAVYVASPNQLHAEQAIQSIEAGKPVLVEKPLAVASADAEAVFASASRNGVFAMEAMWSRFLPAVEAAKAAIDAGAIGRVTSVSAELAYRMEEDADSRFFDPALGGGAALDLGVYPLSLANFLFGEPDAIDGNWRAARTGVDIRSDFHLRFGEVQAALSCGFDRDGDNAFRIFGTEGALVLSPPFLKAQRLSVFGPATSRLRFAGARSDLAGPLGKLLSRLPLPGRRSQNFEFSGSGLQFEARHVQEAVRSGALQSSIVPASDTIAVLKVIERIRSAPARD